MNLFDDLPEPICRRNVPLGPLTWFQLGGPAEYLIEPRSEAELGTVLRRCHDSGIPLRILGLGANVLVPDEGVRGVVVRLVDEAFTRMVFNVDRAVVGAGVELTKLVRSAVRRGLEGLEALAGIPGTVGGGLRMNCGGRYGEIAQPLEHVRVMAMNGRVLDRQTASLEFGYRRCSLGDDLILGAVFRLRQTDPAALHRRFQEIWAYKQASQPAMGAHSAGCVFRNPKGHSAGQLIDRAGLKGFRMGSAYISERHANFAMADRGGRAADVRRLIDAVVDRVGERFGIRLEPEVKIW